GARYCALFPLGEASCCTASFHPEQTCSCSRGICWARMRRSFHPWTPGKWTPKQHAASVCSPPCRWSAQASPGLGIAVFLPRSFWPSFWPRFLAQQEATGAERAHFALNRAGASRLSGKWNEDDYDMLADGEVVGRIMKAAAAPVGQPWLWALAYGHHEDR